MMDRIIEWFRSLYKEALFSIEYSGDMLILTFNQCIDKVNGIGQAVILEGLIKKGFSLHSVYSLHGMLVVWVEVPAWHIYSAEIRKTDKGVE